MSVYTIVDPGSTHDGDLHKARQLVEIAADVGSNACKFQLLTSAECQGGNVPMDWEWLPELIELGNQKGIDVFASVFDRSGWDYLIHCKCKSAKLSYSQAHKLDQYPHLPPLETVYISQDVMSPVPVLRPARKGDVKPSPMRLIRLWCLPIYPVPYVVNFDSVFPTFNGFSSHCMGIDQEIRAVEAGAKYLEFHVKGPWDSPTPDARFAKSPDLARKLIQRIK